MNLVSSLVLGAVRGVALAGAVHEVRRLLEGTDVPHLKFAEKRLNLSFQRPSFQLTPLSIS